MPCRFAIVCEAEADFRTAALLIERVACEQVAWVDAELLASCSLWVEGSAGRPFLTWADAKRLADQFGIRAHGHFGENEPRQPDARAARRALLVLNHLHLQPPEGIVLLRDDDRQTERIRGLEQARNDSPHAARIAIGLAHRTRECWVLAGFEPANDAEEERLKELCDRLGFDPRLQSHRLNDNADHEVRSPKRVLRELTCGDDDRETDCLRRTDISVFRARSLINGLADFLDEIKVKLLPSFVSRVSE